MSGHRLSIRLWRGIRSSEALRFTPALGDQGVDRYARTSVSLPVPVEREGSLPARGNRSFLDRYDALQAGRCHYAVIWLQQLTPHHNKFCICRRIVPDTIKVSRNPLRIK
jgi:hypothetical protein